MPDLFHLKEFIASPKTLDEYLRKSTSKDLTNLLNDLDELKTFSENIGFDEDPIARSAKYNLTDQAYQTLIAKLKLDPREKELLTLSKKEKFLNFINIFATISFSSCGFVGLFTALGMVISIELLGVLLAPVFAISFLIAIIWNYQLTFSNKEAKENQKLLNFQLKILQQHNTNECTKLIDRTNILNQEFVHKLDLDKSKDSIGNDNQLLTLSSLKHHDSMISPPIAENIHHLHIRVSKKLNADDSMQQKWNKRVGNIAAILSKIKAMKPPQQNEHINTSLSDPNFFQWFKKDAGTILLKLFSESKNLLGSVLVGTTIGLVILKLVAQGAILSLLLTTPVGVGVLAVIIGFIVLTSMIFTIYNMYNHAKRDIISNSTKNVIKQQGDLKKQFELIDHEFKKLFDLIDSPKIDISKKVYDTVFMKDIIAKHKLDLLTRVIELLKDKKLGINKYGTVKDDIELLLTNNPLLIIKLFKKLKDNIISSNEELKKFVQKYQDATGTELAKTAELNQIPPQLSEDIAKQGKNIFDSIKDGSQQKISEINDSDFIKLIEYIENQTLLETDYKFVQQYSETIQAIIQEAVKRLTPKSNRLNESESLLINFATEKTSIDLRKILDRCKNIRKKMLVILLQENKKLQDCFKDALPVLPQTNDPVFQKEEENIPIGSQDANFCILRPERYIKLNTLNDSENNSLLLDQKPKPSNTTDANSNKRILQILNYESQTVTINELISKKWEAAKIYSDSPVAQSSTQFNFWQQPYRQHQKVKKAFTYAGITLNSLP